MTDVGDYLVENYYSKFPPERAHLIPTREMLEQGLAQHPEKLVVIRDDKIRGVALYLTLSDDTYARLKEYDIMEVDVIRQLLLERGLNVHFILLAADGARTIYRGVKEVKRRLNPKTISWWSPDMTKLHRREICHNLYRSQEQ